MDTSESHIDFSNSIISFRVPQPIARQGTPMLPPSFSAGGEILNFLSNISTATEGATMEELLDPSENAVWGDSLYGNTYTEFSSANMGSSTAQYGFHLGHPQESIDASANVPHLTAMLRNLLEPFESGTQANGIMNRSLHDAAGYKLVLSEEGADSLENRKYSTEGCINDSCPITRAAFEVGEEVLRLPCGHCFDPDAISRWLTDEKAECPVCRHALKSKEIKRDDAPHVGAGESEIRNARIALLNSLARANNTVHPFGPRLPPIAQRHASMIVSNEDDDELQEAILRSLHTG